MSTVHRLAGAQSVAVLLSLLFLLISISNSAAIADYVFIFVLYPTAPHCNVSVSTVTQLPKPLLDHCKGPSEFPVPSSPISQRMVSEINTISPLHGSKLFNRMKVTLENGSAGFLPNNTCKDTQQLRFWVSIPEKQSYY